MHHTMENPDLPQEILLEIFSRIPTKSVGKCRTLSKSWNTHLSTSNFINKHLFTRKLTIHQQNLALIMRSGVDRMCIVTSPTKEDELLQTKDIINTSTRWLRVLGSCDGLVLLNTPDVFMLMNPITRKLLTIRSTHPTPSFYYFDFGFGSVCGFGYDSCSHDYKIVQLSSHKSKKTIIVDVYSVKNCVWKRLDDGCYPYGELVPGEGGGDFVNGALHFFIYGAEGHRHCIAAFDLANEVFREIPLPKGFGRQLDDDVPDRLKRHCGVYVVGGCLMIVDNLGYGAIDVWTMKEYGVNETWVKFHIESATSAGGDIEWSWPIVGKMMCFVEDGVLLCLPLRASLFDEDGVLFCDLKRGTMRRVVLGERGARFASGIAFVDSLVSPEGSLHRVEEKFGMY